MQFLLLVTIISLASFVFARSGTNAISYHEYGNGQISGSCDYYSPVSKYAGYITATTLGLSCFSCVQMSFGSNSIFVTVVDTGGMNFDLNEPPFEQLCGEQGMDAGQCTINWVEVSASNCIGNPNSGKSATTPPPPPPPSSPAKKSSSSTTRCGSNWSNANSNCKSACTTNAQCGGLSCYADLSLSPCGPNAVADSSVAAPLPSSSTLSPAASDAGSTPAWAIALIVVAALVLVGLIVVLVQVVFFLRL